MSRCRFALIASCLAAVVAFSSAKAQMTPAEVEAQGDVARRAHALAEQVMSPYCPGRTLADCPSPDAAALRAAVRGRLSQGATEAEVKTELERRFGNVVQAIPRSPFAQAMPVVILALGVALLVLVIARLAPGRRAGAPSTSAPGAVEREIEADLRSRGL
jgi:cytochrome c-type biogenesis protein CcmH/NrfF